MFTYLLALLPVLLYFSNPIVQFFSPSPPQIRRLPRPQLNEDLLALEAANTTDISKYTCPPNTYRVHIFSRAPLVLYIENFLALSERSHLLEISEPLYQPSTVTHNAGETTSHAPSIRDSEVALVPRTDTVRCIEDRARALQGWRDEVWIERLRVQRYRAGGHYAHHFDWSTGRGGWGRVGSFMVWVADSDTASPGSEEGDGGERLEGGGTEFPYLKGKGDRRWCRFVECSQSQEGEEGMEDGERKGVVFKVVPGNAVYWENFMADGTGRGYEETWHAGLPVKKGVKVGLNIWSWGRIE
ncbi:prolyl 4-hydroxylase subunit alpha-3 [Achaetomium macrosporum]|uniref:Prolyl 4-hydroxylase subunit alpha-3 n=1 Tax=Achaetomium macrosporum TaxID=79813 RepID=A0AAN7CAQ7_9PEZI|nr:prolyl 4-hydroxylase subunit alpha-3 [Achaetomium macrosporum]